MIIRLKSQQLNTQPTHLKYYVLTEFKAKKRVTISDDSIVAGAGLEPATFGL